MSRRVSADAPAPHVLRAPAALAPPPAQRPSLAVPAYYTLAPAAALVAVGTILVRRADPRSGNANREDTGVLLIGTGAMLTVAFPFVLGAQIAKRRRVDAERRWDACGPGSQVPEPRLHYAASMLVPGAVLTAAGMWFMARNWRRMMRGEGDQPEQEGDPPDPSHHFRAPYIGLGAGTAVVGTTLLAAGAIHLIARSRLQAAWQRRRGTLSGMGVQPTLVLPSRAAGSYAVGLAMDGRF